MCSVLVETGEREKQQRQIFPSSLSHFLCGSLEFLFSPLVREYLFFSFSISLFPAKIIQTIYNVVYNFLLVVVVAIGRFRRRRRRSFSRVTEFVFN